MDDKKKIEASSEEELEQLGPYQLVEQMQQSAASQGALYRATHETSGATALVLEPAEEDKVPLKDWRVLFSSSASGRYVAMQVEQTPWSVSPERQSAESLVFTFEGVLEGVHRMARALPAPLRVPGRVLRARLQREATAPVARAVRSPEPAA